MLLTNLIFTAATCLFKASVTLMFQISEFFLDNIKG